MRSRRTWTSRPGAGMMRSARGDAGARVRRRSRAITPRGRGKGRRAEVWLHGGESIRAGRRDELEKGRD